MECSTFHFLDTVQNSCNVLATNKISQFKNPLWVGTKEGIHCFTAAVKLPWRIRPPPKRPLKQVNSISSWLPATPPGAHSAGGAGVMLIMGMDVTGASCTQLSSANTIDYKLLQLGHNLPQGWSVLCWQFETSIRPPIGKAFFSTLLPQTLLLCTDESLPLSILHYANHSDNP